MDYKIAVIGQQSNNLGFKALDFDLVSVDSDDEVTAKLYELKDSNQYAIIFLEEQYFKAISEDDYQKLASHALPAIIPLASYKKGDQFGQAKINKIVEKAIGSNIFDN
jgi:V/A-type H+-transporting ATPase subunit F